MGRVEALESLPLQLYVTPERAVFQAALAYGSSWANSGRIFAFLRRLSIAQSGCKFL
jgi:hypothetical protein